MFLVQRSSNASIVDSTVDGGQAWKSVEEASSTSSSWLWSISKDVTWGWRLNALEFNRFMLLLRKWTEDRLVMAVNVPDPKDFKAVALQIKNTNTFKVFEGVRVDPYSYGAKKLIKFFKVTRSFVFFCIEVVLKVDPQSLPCTIIKSYQEKQRNWFEQVSFMLSDRKFGKR